MTATAIQIAEQLKTLMNAAAYNDDFSESFVADRDYTTFYSLDQITSGLSVSILPKDMDIEIITRRGGSNQHGYDTDIGIHELILETGAERDARVDELMGFLEELADFLAGLQVTTADGNKHSPIAIANKPIYDYEALATASVFRSLITVGFGLVRGGS
jgi:hypothetical protein